MTLKEYTENLKSHDWNYDKTDGGLAYFKRMQQSEQVLLKLAKKHGEEYMKLFNEYKNKYTKSI